MSLGWDVFLWGWVGEFIIIQMERQGKSGDAELSMSEKQVGETQITYTILKYIHLIHQYLEGVFIKRLKQKFVGIVIQVRSNELEISNISSIEVRQGLRKFMKKKLCNMERMVLASQNLSHSEYQQMKKDKEISKIWSFFMLDEYVNGKAELYYCQSISSDGIKKKKYQLQSYKKETLILVCDELTPFLKYYKGNHPKLHLLLQYMAETLGQEFNRLCTLCHLSLRRVEVVNQNSLAFTVIGFKKYFIDFYDAVIEVLWLLKTQVAKFQKGGDQSEVSELKLLIKRQLQKKQDINIRYTDGYAVVIGDDVVPEDIDVFMNSDTRRIESNFKEKGEVEFIKENCLDVRKLINRQVNYVQGTLNLEDLTIKTDQRNYERCIQIIKKFISEKKEEKREFYFKEVYHKQTFFKYFRHEIKAEVKDDEGDRVIYFSSEANNLYTLRELERVRGLIENGVQKILIDSTHSMEGNERVKIYPHLQDVQIESDANCIKTDRVAIEITQRIGIQDLDCILCCYRPKDQTYLDTFIEPLLDINTRNSIQKVNKKLQLPYLHRITSNFCANVVVHKFDSLKVAKVMDDFEKIFGEIKHEIRNISILVPVKYEYWDSYLEDFTDYIKEFKHLTRIEVVCRDADREKVRQVLEGCQIERSLVDQKQISMYWLLKCQNLSFYQIQFEDPHIFDQYHFTSLFLSVLHQHIIFNSHNLILILPQKQFVHEQFLIDMSSKRIMKTKNQEVISSSRFKSELMCLNRIMKRNIEAKKQHKYQISHIVVYSKYKEVVGDYFELIPEKSTLVKLTEKFERTNYQFVFKIKESKTVNGRVLQGHFRELQEIREELKFKIDKE